ncbi:hypothetical protein DEJ16_08440 [Curtobacterium sp. MCJR17_055]|uniref:hypothetical protein n=1 Tax=unclassified Curtobacterium TaxID=257496 RepID=UPI000D896ADC|nr:MULTISPECIES: hypothetical protein [unclassified Curtobacterium]PYY35183.1 hypothetical protein DEI87_07865 [Curtobacterium sp. MCBD17_029]PYY42283.1 hypothetical protein DEJ32_02145 [Curtobacterium sp. MCPF17_046]PYY47616.1 hypothetical protein DEI84_10655 [Curtobacterium sp. MCBD17_023]PYY55536.1 hypothetical protein DEJ16_08440 [Curtobacterium sp. MCJR17_055]PYY60282.1 hypothetical protein DEJ26_05560 [Curtobacterium sp. MCPF17_015]
MIEWFMWVQFAIACVIGVAAVVLGLVGRKPDDATVGALALVELLLLVQFVVALIAPAVGNPPQGNVLEFWVYAVSVVLVPPATIVWALIDRTRWSTVVLGAGAFTAAVMVYRMYQIWFALN